VKFLYEIAKANLTDTQPDIVSGFTDVLIAIKRD